MLTISRSRLNSSFSVVYRCFSRQSLSYSSNATTTPSQSDSKPSHPVSSCPEGTVLKGINIFKDGKDPVAQADSSYPDWLWRTIEPKKTEFTDEEKLSLKYLRSVSKTKVRKNSILE